jgi:hypothetical protein
MCETLDEIQDAQLVVAIAKLRKETKKEEKPLPAVA